MSNMIDEFYFPEHLTPLYYSSIYKSLTNEQKYNYNRLFAISANEAIMFFESTLASHIFGKLKMLSMFEDIKEKLNAIEMQESSHFLMFKNYNLKYFPEFYQNGNTYYFFYQPKLFLKIWNFCSSHSSFFSLFYWLVCLQEEKLLNYGKEYLNNGKSYNAEYKKLHLSHLKEEIEHFEIDCKIVNRIWEKSNKVNKLLNGFLFYHLFTRLFLVPKRTSLKVIDEWLKLYPELVQHRKQIKKEFNSLGTDKNFLEIQIGEKVIPKTRQLIKNLKEFNLLNRLSMNHVV